MKRAEHLSHELNFTWTSVTEKTQALIAIADNWETSTRVKYACTSSITLQELVWVSHLAC